MDTHSWYLMGLKGQFILDLYPNATIAYSFRQLRKGYTGSCIKVRRSSDNTTQDIGFTYNNLDEVSLLAFVGANDGFIDTWYDQSGNANNLISASNSLQPRIVLNGVVDKQNGKPAMYSISTNRLVCLTRFPQNYDSAFTVCRFLQTVNSVIPLTTSFVDYSKYYGNCENGGTRDCFENWGTPSIYKNGNAVTTNTGAMYNAFVTGNNRFLCSEFSNVITNSERSTGYFIGTSEHYLQEHITYSTDKSSDKAGIEHNINVRYSIY